MEFTSRRNGNRSPPDLELRGIADDAELPDEEQLLIEKFSRGDQRPKCKEHVTMSLWAILVAMGQLWITVFFGGTALGLIGPMESYISMNFFAHKYTTIPQDQIHCELITNATYCKEAVADNVRWAGIVSLMASTVQMLLGPTLGILSDTYGRKPLVAICESLMLLPVAAQASFVYFDTSLYLWYALLILQHLPILGVWFALVTDLVIDPYSRANAFGVLLVIYEICVLFGMVVGSMLSLRSAMACCVILKIANVVYLTCFFQESLPSDSSKPFNRAQMLPVVGLSILTRNVNLRLLSSIFFISTLAGAGLDKIGMSYLQKYFSWSPQDNYTGLIIGQLSILFWVGFFLRPLISKVGEVGLLFIGQVAGILMCLGMFCASTIHQIFALRAFLVGALSLGFPATAALKGNMVDDFEQGHVQGALTTIKSVAAALGPMIFGTFFTAHASEGASIERFIWILGGLLNAFLLPVICRLPRDALRDRIGKDTSDYGSTITS